MTGSGDIPGRWLAKPSTRHPALTIGADANAGAMSAATRRASKGRGQRRLANACFLVEAAEALPGPLADTASLVSVTLPWGSLLRGVLGRGALVLRGIASIVAPGGRVDALASVVPTDHAEVLEVLDREAEAGIAAALHSVGFELVSMRPATWDDLHSVRSSWARRLGHRPVWRLEFHRCSPSD